MLIYCQDDQKFCKSQTESSDTFTEMLIIKIQLE